MAFIEKESKDLKPFFLQRKYTASARAAMTHILQVKKKESSKGILLPAYIGLSKVEGSGVFDPILKTGINYEFYNLNNRLSIDFNSVENQLKTEKFQLFFLIHYFGCPQYDTEALVKLCHSYNVRVIEDCAHTLLGGLNGSLLGTFGDYSIFSIHKSTSTMDGGFYFDRCGDLPDLPRESNLHISRISLETFANTDILAASSQRVKNYQHVSTWVRECEGVELFFDSIPENAVPLNCPVVVADGKRSALYAKLVASDILPTALYHTLIPEITEEKFPLSHVVANSIINLPTHPDITTSDYPRYKFILKKAIEEAANCEKKS